VAFFFGRDPDENAVPAAFVADQRNVAGPRSSDSGQPDFDALKIVEWNFKNSTF
jgi:hypothetical protein